MISPQIPKTFNRRAQVTNSVKKIKYAQSPKNMNMDSNSTISRIAASPKSQPGNVLQERFNTFQHDAFFPAKNQLKKKTTIPNTKQLKKKEEKQSYNVSLLEISSLYEIYDDKKSDADYYNELDNLIDSLKETKTLLETKEKELAEMHSLFNQSKIEKEQLQEEVDELKYLFQLVQDPNEEAKKEIQDYKDKIDMMNQDIQIQKDQNMLLKKQISSLKDQVKDLQEKDKKCQDLINSVKEENKSLLNSLKEKEEVIEAFNNEDKLNLILHNDDLLEKVSNYEKSDKEKSEQIINLQDAISEAKQQIQKYNEEKEKADAEIQSLLRNNSEIKSKNIEMKNDIRSKEQLISGLESNNIKFQKTIIEQENSIKELNKTIEITRGMLEKMGEDRKVQVIISENGKIAELEESLQEKKHCLKNITEKFGQMKKDFDEKDKKLTKAQKDLMDQTSITVSFASRLTQKESELNELQQSQSILTRQMEDMKKKNQSLEKLLKQKIEQITTILRDKGKEIIQMQQTIKSLTEEKMQSQSKLTNYSEDLQKLKEDIEKFKGSNQNLEIQNKELEKNLSVSRENLKQLENQKVLLETKLNGSSQTVNEMNKKINAYETSIKEYRKIESDLKQSMKVVVDEKQILKQKYEENEKSLQSIQSKFEEIKFKYDDLLKNYQNNKEISKNYEEISTKYNNLLNEFKDQEDQISLLSSNKGTLELKVSQLNEENKNLIYMIEGLQNEINNNRENSSFISNDMKASFISTPKCNNTVSSLQLKIKSQNKKLKEMQKLIDELNEFVQVLEKQIINGNMNTSPHCEKDQLILENKQLHNQIDDLNNINNEMHIKVESLEIENDQLKKELINVKTMTRQLTQVLETFKK